jgi:hypothetical protein
MAGSLYPKELTMKFSRPMITFGLVANMAALLLIGAVAYATGTGTERGHAPFHQRPGTLPSGWSDPLGQ